jgi:hypothetical protein
MMTSKKSYKIIKSLNIYIFLLLFSPYAVAIENHKNSFRNIILPAFNPHAKIFTCKYEADSVPAIDREADIWYQEAIYLTRATLEDDKRDWKKAKALLTKAINRNHWKAILTLATTSKTTNGKGDFKVLANPTLSLKLTEHALFLKIPFAHVIMGGYYLENFGGFAYDKSKTLAFWQMAASMGESETMTNIGTAISGTIDNPDEDKWANRTIGLEMLRCAASQGNGRAAYTLGLDVIAQSGETNHKEAEMLKLLHQALMFGYADAADLLSKLFASASMLSPEKVDPERSERYKNLGLAIQYNPDLRFPNLDKIIPLPPVKIPPWNGMTESLIADAQPIRVINEWVYTGMGQTTLHGDPPGLPPSSFVRNIPRTSDPASPAVYAGEPCPTTGIWFPEPIDDHPQAKVIDPYLHQRFIKAGATMPDATSWGLPTAGKISWHLLEAATKGVP